MVPFFANQRRRRRINGSLFADESKNEVDAALDDIYYKVMMAFIQTIFFHMVQSINSLTVGLNEG